MSFQAFRILVMLTLVTGVAYPLLVTGIAQLVFPEQANGSLIHRGEKVVGSALIGQPFSEPKYFWSRPSATSPMPYNGGASSGSNQGPTNPALKEAVEGRVKALRDAGADPKQPVPVDLVTASGSGLDPHISPAAVSTRSRGSLKCATSPKTRFVSSSPRIPSRVSLESWASRA
jgi:K+-transporting ATPase ATPase C chain